MFRPLSTSEWRQILQMALYRHMQNNEQDELVISNIQTVLHAIM
jgi:hypothetical protein